MRPERHAQLLESLCGRIYVDFRITATAICERRLVDWQSCMYLGFDQKWDRKLINLRVRLTRELVSVTRCPYIIDYSISPLSRPERHTYSSSL